MPTNLPTYGYGPNVAVSPESASPFYGAAPGMPDAGTEFLLNNLAKAINGEYNAIRQYEALLEKAHSKEARKIIERIRNDEINHFRRFSAIYSRLTGGRQPRLEAKPVTKSFKEGIQESILDELDDSKFYQDLSEATQDPSIVRILLNASHDEQRHATWFTYLWIVS